MIAQSNPVLAALSFLLICCGLLAAIGGWAVHAALKPGPLAEPKIILIPRGSGVSVIADTLAREGVISHPWLFKVAARVSGKHAALKAGEYDLAARVPMVAVLERLHEGTVYDRSITIAEGLTAHQIIALLNGVEELEGTLETVPGEGTLLPDTYSFLLGDTKDSVLTRMKTAMDSALQAAWDGRDQDLPFTTKEEALTLASIIEKETGVAGERARIAGVFVNRLKIGMPLQTDPTVIYALTQGKVEEEGLGPLGRRLLTRDMDIDSPYNTYKYPGLPPGPIASPGRDALAAAVHPEQHDFLYFVADGTGGHVFSKTLAEHNANAAKWQKMRRKDAAP